MDCLFDVCSFSDRCIITVVFGKFDEYWMRGVTNVNELRMNVLLE